MSGANKIKEILLAAIGLAAFPFGRSSYVLLPSCASAIWMRRERFAVAGSVSERKRSRWKSDPKALSLGANRPGRLDRVLGSPREEPLEPPLPEEQPIEHVQVRSRDERANHHHPQAD